MTSVIRGKHGLYEMMIGLEIHAQILSSSKLFSPSPAGSHGAPNSCVGLFDVAIPGSLPQLGRIHVEQALRAAIALNCSINLNSKFERKHYFYQDLPLGYQITQQLVPIAERGTLHFETIAADKCIVRHNLPVERIQIEQDSGKSIHDIHSTYSLVDFNRAGCGLIEMVFSPTLSSAEQAGAAIRTLQQLLRHIGVCDGNMETGSLRCDVNISIKRCNDRDNINNTDTAVVTGSDTLRGERVEVKNVSSVQRVMQAIDYEAGRQMGVLEEEEDTTTSSSTGRRVRRETRGFDPSTGATYPLRDKGTAIDYRFFADPDLPVLVVTAEDVDRIRSTFPELPAATSSRLRTQFGLDDSQIDLLLATQGVSYFESVVSYTLSKTSSSSSSSSPVDGVGVGVDGVSIFNWISSDLLGLLNVLNLSFRESPVSAEQMADCLVLLHDNTISAPQCKQLLKLLFEEERGGVPGRIVARKGWKQITDDSEVEALCVSVVADAKHSQQLNKYISGNQNMEKYFFGEVMRQSKGQASPHTVNNVLAKVLENVRNSRMNHTNVPKSV